MTRRHETEVLILDLGYRATCTCGWRGTAMPRHRWQADDECREHLHLVEIARARRRGVTLRSEARYYRRMAEDRNTSDADRRLWAMLAEEIEHRLNLGGEEQEGLW